MLDYTGIRCPVCDKPFQPGDDIVVCPQCGAPYHRECYQKEGKCKFDDLHAEGKSWAPPASPEAPDVSAEIKDQECPNCGKLNAHSALFCDQCGASLSGEPARHKNQKQNVQNPYGNQPPQGGGPFPGPGSPFPGGGVGGSPMPFALDPMGGVGPDELIDDIPAKEVAKLVQNNTAYYLPTFRNQKKYRRNRFNFCAFLFSGPWMLYRKQYKLGSIITVIVFALYIASTYVNIVWSSPLMVDLLTQIGVDFSSSAPISPQQWNAALQLAMENPHDTLLVLLPSLLLGLILVVMIIIGFVGNRLYMNHCVKTIHKIQQEKLPTAEYNVQMQSRGGINIPLTICLIVCYFIVNFLPNFL